MLVTSALLTAPRNLYDFFYDKLSCSISIETPIPVLLFTHKFYRIKYVYFSSGNHVFFPNVYIFTHAIYSKDLIQNQR